MSHEQRRKRKEGEAAALAAALERAAAGLLFTSESDYPYEGFWADVEACGALELDALRTILPWRRGPADRPELSLPAGFPIELRADDAFWAEQTVRQPEHAAAYRELERLMRALVPSTIRGPAGDVTARIFTATLPEQGHPLGPYFVLGRLPGGAVVGLRTFRVWT
jgi:hypothetical protein